MKSPALLYHTNLIIEDSSMVIDIGMVGEAVGGAVTAIGGIYAIVKRLMTNSKRKKEDYRNSILKEAKQEAQKIVDALEDKVNKLEIELKAQEMSISKDLDHFKEIYSNELKGLGEKIELLRADVAQANSSIVGLLTKLVNR